jgi:uncharacterized protein
MPRPRKRRMVDRAPLYTGFRPVENRSDQNEEVRLFWEELEALRLKDLERLDQAQAAERMGVSRPTFQRILRAARSKVAQALIDGLALRVDGGTFELPPRQLHCRWCGQDWQEPYSEGPERALSACPACGHADVERRHRESRRHSN